MPLNDLTTRRLSVHYKAIEKSFKISLGVKIQSQICGRKREMDAKDSDSLWVGPPFPLIPAIDLRGGKFSNSKKRLKKFHRLAWGFIIGVLAY